MVVRLCTRRWGNETTVWSDPRVAQFDDVIYSPFSATVFFDRYAGWGVYNQDGTLIPEATYFRGPGLKPIGQSQKLTLPEPHVLERAPDETYIYGGPVIPHFGHWLISSLARLWLLVRNGKPAYRILCHADHEPQGWWNNDYVRHVLGALGLTPSDFAWSRTPMRVRHLIVPLPAVVEQHLVHRVYSELCRHIGARLSADGFAAVLPDPSKHVYLSKTKLSRGVARIVNEQELVDAFTARGVLPINPEGLSLIDQIALFSPNRVVFGMTGSAFHVAALAPTASKVVVLTPKDFINTNLTLLDRVSNTNATYLYPPGGITELGSDANFAMNYRLEDPDLIAEAMISFCS